MLIEVNCETDFVARNDDFQKLVRELAMQVAGLAPQYVTIESIPAEVLEAKRAELLADEDTLKKPENIRGQIVDGQLQASGTSRSCSTSSRSATPTRPSGPDHRRRSPASARTSACAASPATQLGEEL